jgi:hypothetical protein
MSHTARRMAAAAAITLGLLTGAPGLAAADELCTRHPDACETRYVPQGTDHGARTTGTADVRTCILSVICW